MENTELQKWIDFFASIGFIRVDLEKNKKDVIAKFKRCVCPKNFNLKNQSDKVWFYIEIKIYSNELEYKIVSKTFNRRDEVRILSCIVDPAFTKATGDFKTMEKTLFKMSEKLEVLLENPTPYIKRKLDEISV